MPPENTLNQEALVQARIDIVALQTQVEHQGREIGELKGVIQILVGKIDNMAATLSEARGGWKFMMALGGAGATFGAFIGWLVQHLGGRGAP
jgi:hypothetical protein